MITAFTTPRLLLRSFCQSDAAAFYQLNADPEVLRYTGDRPFASVAAAAQFIARYDHYQRHGFGRWALCLHDTFIGFCGLRQEQQEVDLGFRLMRCYWHQGYAYEAARACLQLGFGYFGLPRIVGRAMANNSASLRLLAKLAMRYSHDFSAQAQPWQQWQITREQYHAHP